jgi:hypothetical protein
VLRSRSWLNTHWSMRRFTGGGEAAGGGRRCVRTLLRCSPCSTYFTTYRFHVNCS